MEDVIKILKGNPRGFLATVDNGMPRVRPFGFMFEEEGKLYFCTNDKKEVFKQLNVVPYIEYAATTKDMVTVRVSGEVKFCDDLDKKEKALNASERVKEIYKSAENPIFKVFFLEHGNATISDFSGRPPKSIDF